VAAGATPDVVAMLVEQTDDGGADVAAAEHPDAEDAIAHGVGPSHSAISISSS
jgi:hypothetical protein